MGEFYVFLFWTYTVFIIVLYCILNGKVMIFNENVQKTPNMEEIYNSTPINNKKFYNFMKANAHIVGSVSPFIPYEFNDHYELLYEKMNNSQLAWYIFWRSKIRNGIYLDTDYSYILLYIFETLSGVGWYQPKKGLEILSDIWINYGDKHNKLNYHLARWVLDFAMVNKLPFVIPERCVFIGSDIRIDNMIQQYAKNIPLKLPFALIISLSGHSMTAFYKKGNQEMFHESIPRVIELVDVYMRKKKGKGIFDIYEIRKNNYEQRIHLFSGSICPMADQKMYIKGNHYSIDNNIRKYFGEIVRFSENILREIRGNNSPLKDANVKPELAKIIKDFLINEYSNKTFTSSSKNNKNTKLNLDFNKINKLRSESDEIRESLRTDFDNDFESIENITPKIVNKKKEQASLNFEKISKLRKESDAVRDALNVVTEEIELIEEPISKIADKEKSNIKNEVDIFIISYLNSELKDFIGALSLEQKKVLHALLVNKNAQADLKKIADEAKTMIDLLIDSINEEAVDILGGIILDNDGGKYIILEEYQAELVTSINNK